MLDRSERGPPPPPPPEEPTVETTAAAAEQEEEKPADAVYRTKAVEFLGRSTPIILQNDNGPCPLLAICNALLLRNNLDLSPEESQVTQERLLSLVAGRLIDSNSNVQDKDDGYVSNQRQNISDAIDLLPRLATGIDVNVHFRKINDFEFTPECAIFDLLDIGLYHGWIVDPQDIDTAQVIGSKSYNTLVAELVAFETGTPNEVDERIPEEDCIDFAAATTATLGVPSPSLSRGRSFEDSPAVSDLVDHGRKGDREETEQLMRALDLSRNETYSTVSVTMSHDDWNNSSLSSGEGTHMMSSVSEPHGDSIVQSGDESETSHQLNMSVPTDCNLPGSYGVEDIDTGDHLSGSDHTVDITRRDNSDQPVSRGSGDFLASFDSTKNVGIDVSMQDQSPAVISTELDESGNFAYKDQTSILCRGQSESYTSPEDFTSHVHGKLNDDPRSRDLEVLSSSIAPCADPHISNGTNEPLDVSGEVVVNLAGSEPIYEGEECVLHSGLPAYEDREPVYEGEVVLAEQAGRVDESAAASHLEDKVHRQEYKRKLIKNFLENNASQLTIYGLFALQEGLKERELCVFFRNNHFGTMFKFNGELYLLVTDQGYVNQPDLVWEKLNEVNGDTVFMTGNFKEFKADSQVTSSWNEQHAMNSTAEYIAGLDNSSPSTSTYNSDLQLAIELQKQEYELQPQRPQQQSPQQPIVSGRPRLVTGPQVARSSAASQRNDSKTKDKCNIM